MTTLAHVISGSYIALYTAGISPSETSYVLAAIASPAIIDLDHIFFLIKDKKTYQKEGYLGNLYKARSVFHELVGFATIGAISLGVSFFDTKMAYVIGVSAMIHLAEDVIMGISFPFNPIDKMKISLLPQRREIKILVDIAVILLFGFLWIQYLSVHN